MQSCIFFSWKFTEPLLLLMYDVLGVLGVLGVTTQLWELHISTKAVTVKTMA